MSGQAAMTCDYTVELAIGAVDPWATLDGRANAPAGTPQYPTLLNGYVPGGVTPARFNAASSVLDLDGTQSTVNAGTQAAGTIAIWMGGDLISAADAFDGLLTAGGIWPSAFNSTQLGNMDTNLQYWLAAIPSVGGASMVFNQVGNLSGSVNIT